MSAGAVTAIVLALAVLWQRDWALYNATPSMPVGLYLRTNRPIERGAIVTVRAVDVSPDYATQRGFTDARDRFLKRVVGAAGDTVCAISSAVTVNGRWIATRLSDDAAGRRLNQVVRFAFPAHAGINRRSSGFRGLMASVPRTRGDQPSPKAMEKLLAARSPHTRRETVPPVGTPELFGSFSDPAKRL